MADDKLTAGFNDVAAQPSMLHPEAYRTLLEKLLAEGKGYGKTQSVAAYLLRDMRFVNESEGDDGEHRIRVEPLYVIMDLKEWPNSYGRSLALQEITSQYAKRMVGEADINAPDFSAPGIWTAKKKAFETDYLLRKTGEANLYDPDPDAFRVCIVIDAPVTIPTPWGAPWTIGAGGALAIREKDIPGLASALHDVCAGTRRAEDALFTKLNDGKTAAAFDVYGMQPGFIDRNYGAVELKPATTAAMAPFRPAPRKTMPVLRLKKNSG